jgi:hypothetical protein
VPASILGDGVNENDVVFEKTASGGFRKPKHASDKQLNWIRDLMESQDLDQLPENQRVKLQQPDEFWDWETTRLSGPKASRIIDALKNLPRAPRYKDDISISRQYPAVENGRYAVEKDGVAGAELMFYFIKNGYNPGVIFVDVYASDARYPIKDPVKKLGILTAIAVDPLEAGLRFGREIGRCFRCGRVLTKKASRKRGAGDECAAILGI